MEFADTFLLVIGGHNDGDLGKRWAANYGYAEPLGQGGQHERVEYIYVHQQPAADPEEGCGHETDYSYSLVGARGTHSQLSRG